MTPAARVQAAIEILDQILDGAPAEKALTGWARRSRFAGSKDRAAVRDHVFDALRRRNSAAHIGGAMTGRGLMIGVLRQDGVAPESLFTGDGHAPAPLDDEEKRAGDAPFPLDIPGWLEAPLRASLGAGFRAAMAAMGHRAPVVLRLNGRHKDKANALKSLAEDGIEAEPMALVESALEVRSGARRIKQSAAFKRGVVELQDAASQAMVAALPLKDGMRILDYCAGGGGKTLAMAGRVEGTFYAHDAAPRRMADLPERARRAGIQVTLSDAPQKAAPYDLVLCDVPCSGSGTWRRTPDAKWKFSPEELEKLQSIQMDILEVAKDLVAEDGVLAYATCSFLAEENTDQIRLFLAKHPEWTLRWERQFTFEDGGDGFFGAVLQRKPKI